MIDLKILLEHTSNLSVLYVEDDMDLLDSTTDLLSSYFNHIDTAVNGQEGYDKYIAYEKEHGVYYDLVVTDINMPELNGIQMAKKIYTCRIEQAIIITTAHDSTEYLLEAISIGIDGFITKPIGQEQLHNTLFKISRFVNDHKMVEEYISQVENLNMELENKYRDLELKNKESEKSLRMLDTVISQRDSCMASQSDAKVEVVAKVEVKDVVSKPKDEVATVDKISKAKDALVIREEIKVQIIQLIGEDLPELKEVLDEIDVGVIDIINSIESISDESLEELGKLFLKYASILHYYTFFVDLSVAMTTFATTVNEVPLPENDEMRKNIFMFLETFVYVLIKWQNDLSSDDDTKINQLDASMISDMNTITNMWVQKEEEVCDDDMDDIFDF